MASITVLQNDNPAGTRVTLDDNRVIINNNFAALNTELGQKYVKPGTGIPATDLDAATQATLGAVADKAPAGTGTAGAVTKADVGLSNADNTSDVNKPVSTAQAAAINAKYTRPGTGIPESDLDAALQAAIPNLDAGDNASIGLTIFVPSGAFGFEKTLSQNGAVMNGVADDAAALQAALDALPATKFNDVRIPERVSAVKLNSGITVDVTRTYLRGMGATFNFSGMTTGQAVTITGSGTNNTYGQGMGGMEHIFFNGPGRYSAVDGLLFTGSGVAVPNTGSARCLINSCWVRNWRKATTYFNRSYLTTMFSCEVGSSLIGVYSAANAYDAYENAAFVRGVVGNNDVNVYLEDGLLTMFGTSLDYAEWVQIAIRSGSLQLSQLFMEYAVRNGNYGTIGGIYSGNAPLCAIDLQPGTTSAIRNDIGLQTTSPSAGSNWTSLRINGGQWVVKDPRGGTSANNTLICHVNQGGGYFGTAGRPHYDFNGWGTQSGYIVHNLATYNTTGNYSGACDWDPGFFNGTSDVPNQIVDNVTAYLPNNTTQGLSISPAHNMLGSYGISGTAGIYSFENDGDFSENVTIVEDSDGTTTAILPANRVNGIAGSVGASATFAHTGTRSLKLTKTGAAGQPFKVAIDVPLIPGAAHRPVFRGVAARPATGGPTAGSININLAFIRDDMARISDAGAVFTMSSNAYLVTGGVATSASSVALHSASVYKATSGSLFADVTTLTAGSWFAFQMNSQPDIFRPTWAKTLRIEIDLKNMGPGEVNFDSFDLQPM